MSHIVEIRTEVRDAGGVRAACDRLRLEPPVEGKTKLFGREVEGLSVRLRDWRYPVVFKTATGEDFQQDFGAMMFVDQKLTDEFSEEIWGGELSLFRPCLRIYALQIEDTTHRELPVCRCIYYEDGSVGADYHADLPAYGNLSCIASISLGRNGNSRSVALRTKTISTAST